MRDTIRKSANRYGRKNAPKFDSCQQMRRFVRKHGTLNMATGESQMTSQEWVTEKCNAPLFGDESKTRGTCRSCFNGWTHPENYPV
jgi:hypothetical protein